MKARFVWLSIASTALSSINVAHAQQLRTFSEPNFTGQQRVFRDPQPNLQTTRPTKIGSVRLEMDKWLICEGSNYGGDCLWVSGNITSLAALGFSVTPGSLKPERVPLVMRHWGDRRPAPRDQLALFEKPDFDGEWTALRGSVTDFDTAHLKSPGSLVLGDGLWRLCTGINFSGRCLTVTGSAWDIREIFPGRILSAERLK